MTGLQGQQGLQGVRGTTGPQGAQGLPGIPGAAGAKGDHGNAATIDHVEAITGEPGSPAYAYNTGTEEHADLVFVIPPGAMGPGGPMGPAGPAGPAGEGCEAAYGGLYNTAVGEFCTQPGEIIAMTFSDGYPAAGMHCDGDHSIVLESDGVYEIQYAMRADSKGCTLLNLAVTNDGSVIPCSRITEKACSSCGFTMSGAAVVEARKGAHLHFIAYSDGCACFMLQEGVNLMMYVKKLGDLKGPDPDPNYGRERGREREREREREFERERGYDKDRYPLL